MPKIEFEQEIKYKTYKKKRRFQVIKSCLQQLLLLQKSIAVFSQTLQIHGLKLGYIPQKQKKIFYIK